MMNMSSMPSWFGLVIIAVMVAAELLFCALPALFWALIGKQRLVEAFAWRKASAGEYFGSVLMGLGFIGLVQVLVVIQNEIWPRSMAGQKASNEFLLPLIQHDAVLMTLALPLSAAFSEELLFRGVLQRALVKRMPVRLAVSVAALVFSAVHFDLQGFVVRILLGILLAVLVLRGRSIFPAMLTHFIYDAGLIGGSAWAVHEQGLSKVLQVSSRADMGVGRLELLIYGAAGTLLIALGWSLCVRSWRRNQFQSVSEPEAG